MQHLQDSDLPRRSPSKTIFPNRQKFLPVFSVYKRKDDKQPPMDIVWILAEQIGLFVIYIVVGILLVKTRVLTRDTLETISRFVMKLAMPVMIFTNTVDGVDRSSLLGSLSLLGLTALLYACTFVMAKLMAAAFRLQGDRAQVYRALTMFGNVGFMGIPIVSSIFPDYGML